MHPSTDERTARAVLGVGPLALASAGVLDAVALGTATLVALAAGALAGGVSRRFSLIEVALALQVLAIAVAVTATQMALQAWLPALQAPVDQYFPLAVLAAIVLLHADARAPRKVDAGLVAASLLALVLIAALRQASGRESLPAVALALLAVALAAWNRRR